MTSSASKHLSAAICGLLFACSAPPESSGVDMEAELAEQREQLAQRAEALVFVSVGDITPSAQCEFTGDMEAMENEYEQAEPDTAICGLVWQPTRLLTAVVTQSWSVAIAEETTINVLLPTEAPSPSAPIWGLMQLPDVESNCFNGTTPVYSIRDQVGGEGWLLSPEETDDILDEAEAPTAVPIESNPGFFDVVSESSGGC